MSGGGASAGIRRHAISRHSACRHGMARHAFHHPKRKLTRPTSAILAVPSLQFTGGHQSQAYVSFKSSYEFPERMAELAPVA